MSYYPLLHPRADDVLSMMYVAFVYVAAAIFVADVFVGHSVIVIAGDLKFNVAVGLRCTVVTTSPPSWRV